jgi:hypothetical protein
LECLSPVYVGDKAVCIRGHAAHEGWYVSSEGKVIGLGHEHLGGYLTSNGIDLTGYRLLGALKEPQVVVDLKGRMLVTQAVLRRFVRVGLRVICLDPDTNARVLLKPSTPVRPLPRTKGSAKLLRAMFRATHEVAA